MIMKTYILLKNMFKIFIILFFSRQLLVVQWKQFAISFESRNQTYDHFQLWRRLTWWLWRVLTEDEKSINFLIQKAMQLL